MKSLLRENYMDLVQMLILTMTFIMVLAVTPASAINGGVPDDEEHPNVGLMATFSDGQPVGACTSTLISSTVVLTAAHCIEDALAHGSGASVMVNFDEDPLYSGNWHLVNQLIPHPEYYWGPTSKIHDIGLLLLANEINNISPAKLPDEGFLTDLKAAGELIHAPHGVKFVVVGFGITLDWPATLPEFIPQPRMQAESGYRSLLKGWLNLSQNEATNDGGSCFGDSGGPVFWKDSAGKETIVGITSWGDPHCVSPSFNYRVDIKDSLDFISPYLVDDERD